MTGRDETYEQTMKLAGRALAEARAGRWEAVGTVIQEIVAGAGASGLLTAVTAWCDTLVVYQRRALGMPDDFGPQEIVRPVWVDDEKAGASTTDADAVDPASRWVGQVLAARANMDHGAYQALLSSVPLDDIAVHLAALLESVALGLNAIAAGAV